MRDEAGDAGVDDGVEALAGLDAADFVDGVVGESRDVEIFFGAGGGPRSGEQSGAALDGPGEEDLRRSFSDARGDGCDDGIFEETGLHAVTQRSEGEKDDVVLFAELEGLFGFIVGVGNIKVRGGGAGGFE